ncbi:MAG: PilZ domain-containing protein [Candidatus Eremiobacteraeota bacterium]|nr:PilZ domain-containing protein [Candidatus Eremiobacteraeota bacterium]
MSVSPASSNRRSFYRQPMYLRIDVRVTGVRIPIPSTLVDISAGGCQVHARTMLKPHLAIEFDLPRTGMPPLRLAGRLRKVTYTASDRTFRYAVEFDALSDTARDDLARYIHEEQRRSLSLARRGIDEERPKPSTRLQELRAHRRVEVNIPVTCTVGTTPGNFEGVAVDVSTGGLRLISDRVLRQEWDVTVRFTLPNDVLRVLHSRAGVQRPFSELRLVARPLPGVKQTRGRYMQSLVWVNPDPQLTDEIHRFVEAAQYTSLRAGR